MNLTSSHRSKRTSKKAWGLILAILGLAMVAMTGHAEVQFKIQVTPNVSVPDQWHQVSSVTIGNAGISEITGVTASVVLDSPSAANPMWLGDMFASLTHGNPLEAFRTATLFDFHATDPDNDAESFSGSYSTSAFNGPWLASNEWSLLVADREQGGVGRLKSWDLAVRGTAASFGTIDPGAGGEISMTGSGTQEIGARANSTGSGASAVALKSEDGQILVFAGGLSGDGFRKTGSGVVEIAGNSLSFNGQLDVEAGKLVVSGTLGSSSTLSVGNGGTLGGSGTVGFLQIASGGTLAVGNSPGRLRAGHTTWSGGAKYAWEIDDAAGNESDFLAGQGTHWDFLDVTGVLNITATTTSRIIIDVISLLASDNAEKGVADNWDPFKGYSFAIATATEGIQIAGNSLGSEFYGGNQSVFDAALNSLFEIRTTAFLNAADSAALWSISTASEGTTMLLNYGAGATAIPEPSSASLLVLGLAGVLAMRRRCRI